jgi:hypothetical protein
MSIIFRTKPWLTVSDLATAWARELPSAEQDFDVSRSRLLNRLLEDAVNERLDDVGPLVEHQRLGLRIITPDFRAGFLKGEALLNALKSGADLASLQHLIVIMKEAVLAFAQRHALPPPSWWRNEAEPTTGQGNSTETAASLSGAISQGPTPRCVRKAPKLEAVKQRMRAEIQRNELTTLDLGNMLEKELAEKYRVSRDTARKARYAVLSDQSRSTKATNDY